MLKTNERAPSPAPTARVTYRAALAKDAADQAEVFYHAVMQGAATHYGLMSAAPGPMRYPGRRAPGRRAKHSTPRWSPPAMAGASVF